MTRTSCFLYVALYALTMLVACPQPLPPTPPPTPVADAAPPDNVFAGKTFDCTGMDTTSAQPYANTCGDMTNTGTCLVNYVNTGVPVALMACAARDAETAAFVEVAKGTANDTTKARASRLRAWFWAEGMTLRSAP